MSGPDERLSPELQELLRAEREAPGPSEAARARVWARVHASVTPGGGGGEGGPTASPTATKAGASAWMKAAVVAATLSAAGGAALWTNGVDDGQARATPIARVAGTDDGAPLAHPAQPTAAQPAGAAAASAGPNTVNADKSGDPLAPPPRSAADNRPLAAATVLAVTAPLAGVEPGANAAIKPHGEPAQGIRHARRTPRSGGHRDRSAAVPGAGLQEEVAMLQPARQALLRGEGAAALSTLQAHRARFPSGELAEERDALMIEALIGVGRGLDARGLAARFLARYPGSLLRTTVEQALARAEQRERPNGP